MRLYFKKLVREGMRMMPEDAKTSLEAIQSGQSVIGYASFRGSWSHREMQDGQKGSGRKNMMEGEWMMKIGSDLRCQECVCVN